MAGLSFSGKMSVKKLQDNFLSEFGLFLRIYDGRSFAAPSERLANIRKNENRVANFEIKTSTKVGTLEKMFNEDFGLSVRVASPDNSSTVLKSITLNAAKKLFESSTPDEVRRKSSNSKQTVEIFKSEKEKNKVSLEVKKDAHENLPLKAIISWSNFNFGSNFSEENAKIEDSVGELSKFLNKEIKDQDWETLDFIDAFFWDAINHFEAEYDGEADEEVQRQFKEILAKIWPNWQADIDEMG